MENTEAFTVTEITKHIKNILEGTTQPVWIKGELSNFKHHSSGHMYFSLKDEKSRIRCVFFKRFNSYLRFTPENGMMALCYGKITVYEKQGQYQIMVNQMKPLGKGELEIAFQQLKQKLTEEGLFEKENKQDIPKFPRSVGIVTASTGAALQDIKNVLSRRFPVNIFLISARVQGQYAAREIAGGINKFNRLNNIDVMIVGRGGGSLEDLWAFNEEIVARAIFNSTIPVISAVGHEVDFTIADFVADLRAPTPSAAAELVVPDRAAVKEKIENLKTNIHSNLINNIDDQRNKISHLNLKLQKNHPRYVLQQYSQQLDEITYLLNKQVSNIQDNRILLDKTKAKFYQSFERMYKQESLKLSNLLAQMQDKINKKYNTNYESFINLAGKLEELNPLKTLVRGYAIVKKDSEIINSIKKIRRQDRLEVVVSDGKIDCKVKGLSENKSQ